MSASDSAVPDDALFLDAQNVVEIAEERDEGRAFVRWHDGGYLGNVG